MIMEQPKVTLAGIEAQIVEWLETQPGGANETFIAEMLRTVIRLTRDGTSRGDLKILNRALKELRYAFRIFAPYRSVRKVSIFGSTRIAEDDPYYLLAKNLGRGLAEAGFMIITGAGPGIMQAGREGAGREKSSGGSVRLPSTTEPNTCPQNDRHLAHFEVICYPNLHD